MMLSTDITEADAYDYPIHERPSPKPDSVAKCIAYLRDHGDHYGVQLLTGMTDDEKDAEDSERAR